jgi:hypothetical protein
VNLREWLDLTVSDISQFSAPYVENAIAEIGPDGLFEGFILATAADMTGLAQSAGIDVSTDNFSINEAATRHLVELLGPTFARPSEGAVFAVGWLDEFFLEPSFFCPCRANANIAVNPRSGASGMAGLFILNGDDLASHGYHAGLMLYRAVIPEPSVTMLVISSALTILSLSRRRSA